MQSRGSNAERPSVPVPGSGFSLLMDALFVVLAKQVPVHPLIQLLGLYDGQKLNRLLVR